MLFGLEEIRSCPFCKAHGRLQTIASGNSVGAKSWSDGYTYAPWCLPELLITQCLTCLKTFWIKDANLIAEFDNDIDFHPSIFDLEKIENRLRKYFGIRKSRLQMWKELKYLKQLKKEQLIEAVESKLWTNQEEEIYLRQNLWWILNDVVRKNSASRIQQEVSTVFDSNLRSLIDIYKNSEDDILLKAEAYRELGEFETSTEILSTLQTDRISDFEEVIKKANEEKNKNVLLVFENNIANMIKQEIVD